jgi:hypothetical protein
MAKEKTTSILLRRVWRYQRGNENPSVNRRRNNTIMAKSKSTKE